MFGFEHTIELNTELALNMNVLMVMYSLSVACSEVQ